MNLKKVLHPEIIRGTRGEPHLIGFYKLVREAVSGNPENPAYWDIDQKLAAKTGVLSFLHDPNCLFTIGMAFAHKDQKAPTYHVCRNFLQALMGIPDREVPIKYLPERFFGYLSFSDKTVTDGEDFLTGAYVYYGPPTEDLPIAPHVIREGKTILMIAPTYEIRSDNQYNSNMPPFGKIFTQLDDTSETAHDIYTKMNQTNLIHQYTETGVELKEIGLRYQHNYETLRIVLNCLLYINSQDPELLRLTPTFGKSSNQKKKYRQGEHLNECTIPVIALNWDYRARTPSAYRDTTVQIDTFMRWQRCGPGLSQVKLIWVEPHERTIKKKINSTEGVRGGKI